jgi:tRNA(adenine34) deaminase
MVLKYMYTLDEKFMVQALKEAEKSANFDEVPVGAVIVKEGKIIARGHNLRERNNDPTAHAEIVAIRKACKKLKSWRLEGCTIYVTIEPCSMCAGTLLWSRIQRIVYGAKDPKGGALGSSYSLFEVKNINHRPEITGGVLEERCSTLMTSFFRSKR